MFKPVTNDRMMTTMRWSLFLLPALLFVASLYWQFVLGDQPCPLCVVQRFLALALALWWLVPLCYAKWRQRQSCVVVGMVLALLALGANLWQIWLQNQPSPYPEGVCVPGVAQMIPQSSTWWGRLLDVGGDCHEVSATFLGVQTTHWVTVVLMVLVCLSVLSYRLARKT